MCSKSTEHWSSSCRLVIIMIENNNRNSSATDTHWLCKGFEFRAFLSSVHRLLLSNTENALMNRYRLRNGDSLNMCE